MSKFSQIVKGARAERPFHLPPVDGAEGEGVAAILRPLNGIEEEEVLVAARMRAIGKGVEAPYAKIGEPIYDFALMIETLVLAVLDPDSPKDSRQPIFSSADEIKTHFGRDAIAYIYEAQQRWNDEVSPRISKMNAKEYIESIDSLGSPDEEKARRFLDRCSPGLLGSFARSMAVQLWTSLWGKSPSGSSSDNSGKSTSSPPAS